MYKKRLLFDFDGVIHSYISGWQGINVANDLPVTGIKDTIDYLRATEEYEIVIYSSRCSSDMGIQCIKDYCEKWNIYYDEISKNKQMAYLTIDDRAICFDGNGHSLLKKIKEFKPWTQLGSGNG